MKDLMNSMIKTTKPFAFMVPILLIFFCAYAWQTKDPKIIEFLKQVTNLLIGGSAIGVGHSLANKR